MSNKTYKSSLFKRIIDLGKVPSADVDDLVRIWRVGTGDEKAITLQNFVETVDADLGGEGLTLTEIVTLIGEELGDFVTLNTDQTITGEKTFDNDFLSLVGYNPTLRIKATSNQSTLNFRNFTNEDQAGIILDTPSSKLSIVTRTDNSDIEINPHGTGSIVLPNVASGTGDFVRIDSTTGKLTKRTTAQVSAEVGGISDAPNDGLSYIRKNLSWVDSKTYDFGSSTAGTANIIDSVGNVTYSTTSANISVVTHSLINLRIMTVSLLGISSTGSPSGGSLLIQASGDSTFFGLNVENSKAVITVTRLSGTSYSSTDISLFNCQITTKYPEDIVSLRFKNIATNTSVPAFTSTNAGIMITILSYD